MRRIVIAIDDSQPGLPMSIQSDFDAATTLHLLEKVKANVVGQPVQLPGAVQPALAHPLFNGRRPH